MGGGVANFGGSGQTTAGGPILWSVMVSAHRKDLIELVEQLPEEELASARRYLQYLRDMNDPLLRALREAPLDDEPVTEEDKRAIEEAREDFANGRTITTEELSRRLGL